MNKATTKDGLTKQTKRYNTQVVSAIASSRNVTEDFVRKCLRGDRHSETADQIRSEYEELSIKITNAIFGE